MSKHRVVKSDFWIDDYFEDRPVEERLFYLYLMTNPETNILGIYRTTIKRMAFESGLSAKDEIVPILDIWSEKDKVHFIGNHILMVNFQKHNIPSGTMRTGIKTLIGKLPSEIISFILSKKSRIYNRLSLHYSDAIHRANKDKDINKGKDKDQDINKNESDFESGLEEKKSRLLETLKAGMIKTWQYLEKFPEPELEQDAIEVIKHLRVTKNPNSNLPPDKNEIEQIIEYWLFSDDLPKETLIKLINGAGSVEFEKVLLQVSYILKPHHRAKLLQLEESMIKTGSERIPVEGEDKLILPKGWDAVKI